MRVRTCQNVPMPPTQAKPYRSSTSKSIPRTFRISHTHNNLLNQASHKDKASAIVKVLLTLFFNHKLGNIDDLIEAEYNAATAASRENNEKFKLFVQSKKRA